MFKIFFPFLLSLLCKVYSLEVYITDRLQAVGFGSLASPYNNFITAIVNTTAILPANASLVELNFLFLTDLIVIVNSDITAFSANLTKKGSVYQLFPNLTQFKLVRIMPYLCFQSMVAGSGPPENCPFRTRIALKADNFTFLINTNFYIQNLQFNGNDMNIIYNNLTDFYCYYSYEGCCRTSYLISNPVNTRCVLQKAVAANNVRASPFNKYSLFYVTNDTNNTLFQVVNCEFNYINGIAYNAGFSTLFAASYSINHFFMLYINSTLFSYSYLKDGMIELLNSSLSLQMVNVTVSNYNFYLELDTVKQMPFQLANLLSCIVANCSFLNSPMLIRAESMMLNVSNTTFSLNNPPSFLDNAFTTIFIEATVNTVITCINVSISSSVIKILSTSSNSQKTFFRNSGANNSLQILNCSFTDNILLNQRFFQIGIDSSQLPPTSPTLVTISGLNFTNNTGISCVGGFFLHSYASWSSNGLLVINITLFNQVSITGYGCLIYLNNQDNSMVFTQTTINSSSFLSDSNTTLTSVIYSASIINISKSVFYNISAKNLMMLDFNQMNIFNSTFEVFATNYNGIFQISSILTLDSVILDNIKIPQTVALRKLLQVSLIITNSFFSNILVTNQSSEGGFFVMPSGGSVTVNNSIFTNFSTNGEIAILVVQYGVCFLNNVQVTSSYSYSGIGLFYFANSTISFANVYIADGKSKIGQGLIYLEYCFSDFVNITIINSINSEPSLIGGCFSLTSNNNINISNSTFVNLYQYNIGNGLAFLQPFSKLRVDNCSFLNITNRIFHISQNCSFYFLNSFADTFTGPCFYSDSLNYIYISNSFFVNGATQQQGAFIYLNMNSSLVINNSIIENLHSISEGAVIFANQYNFITLVGSSFINNFCGLYGGVFSLFILNVVNVMNNSFSSNFAKFSGGTGNLYQNNILNVNASNFMSNEAFQEGGVFNAEEDNVIEICNSYFFNNSANTGGIIRLFQNNVLSLSLLQVLNTSVTTYGGVFLLIFHNILNLTSSLFSNSSSAVSGAMASAQFNNILNFFNISIQGSLAQSRAGILYAQSSNFVNFTLTMVEGSYSFENAGFLYAISNNHIFISNCYFMKTWSRNEAGFMYVLYSNLLEISDSSIIDCQSIQESAGLIFSYQNNIIDINNCSLLRVSTKSSGGVFYFIMLTQMNFTNNLVSNISISQDSGAFFNVESTNFLQIVNTTILDVKSMNYDGVFIYLLEQNVIYFVNCSVKSYAGSAIEYESYILSSQNNSLNLINVSFLVDYSKKIFDFSSSNLSLSNVKFEKSTKCAVWGVFTQSSIKINNVDFSFEISQGLLSMDSSNLTLIKFIINPIVLQTQTVTLIDAQSSNITLKKGIVEFNFQISSLNFLTVIEMPKLAIFKVSFSGMKSANSLPYFDLSNIISLTIKLCSFLLTSSLDSGGVFKVKSSQNLNFSITRSIFVANRARNEAGSIYVIQTNKINASSLSLLRTCFYNNRATQGGSLAIYNITEINIKNSLFQTNKADMRILKSATASKGGVFYLESLTSTMRVILIDSKFMNNSAEIGGVLSKNGSISILSNNSIFKNNNARYYGKDLASEIINITFLSDDWSLQTKSLRISSIASGRRSSTNFILIGIDEFSNFAYNSETFSKSSLSIQEIGLFSLDPLSNQLPLTLSSGFLDLTGPYSRLSFPMESSFSYIISLITNTKSKVQLFLDFRSCLPGERLNDNYTCLECDVGEYSFNRNFDSFSPPCSICSDALPFYCFGGARLTPKPNYWRLSADSSNFMKCSKEVCLGDPRDPSSQNFTFLDIYSNGICAVGYTGIECDECEEGYGKVNQNTCAPCDGGGYGTSLIIQLVLRTVFTLFSIFSAMNLNQLLSKRLNENDEKAISSNILKVFINHIQVLTVVLYLPFKWPDNLSYSLSIFFSLSPSISESLSLECVLKSIGSDFHQLYFRVISTLIYPILLLIICLIAVALSKMLKLNLGNPKIRFYWYPVSLWMTIFLLCYSDVVQVLFQMLEYQNFGDDYNQDIRVVRDKSIVYYGDEHQYMIQNMGVPLIVIIGIIFPLAILLYLLYKRLTKTMNEELVLFNFGFYFYTFKENYFFWDLLTLLRKISIFFVQLYLFSSTGNKSLYPLNLMESIILLSLIMQINFKPYKTDYFPMINTFETSSLVTLFLTFYFAIMYLFQVILDENSISNYYLGFCGLVPAMANILFVWKFIYLYYKHNIQHQVKKAAELASSGIKKLHTYVKSATRKSENSPSNRKSNESSPISGGKRFQII